MTALFHRLPARVRDLSFVRPLMLWLQGVAAALIVLSAVQPLTEALGVEPAVWLGLLTAAAIGWFLATYRGSSLGEVDRWLSLAAGSVTALFGMQVSRHADRLLQLVSPALWEHSSWQFAAALSMGLFALAIPLFCVGRAINSRGTAASPWHVLGMACGFWTGALAIAAVAGPGLILGSTLAATCLFALITYALARWRREVIDPPPPTTSEHLQPSIRPSRGLPAAACLLGMLLVGGVLAGMEHIIHQWMPDTGATPYVALAGLLSGAVGFGVLLHVFTRHRRAIEIGGSAGSLVAAVIAVAGYGLVVQAALWGNAFVNDPGLLALYRSLLVFLVTAPLGVNLCAFLSLIRREETPFSLLSAAVVPAVIAGYGAVTIAADAVSWLMVLIVAAAGLASLTAITAGITFPSRRARMASAAGIAGIVCLLVIGQTQYRPNDATRLLFSADVASARRSGVDLRLLTAMTDVRPIYRESGPTGSYSVWNSRARQMEIRFDGMPDSFATVDPRQCPDYPVEVLQAVLPLVLHKHSTTVGVLGGGSGTTLKTCLAFPVMEVECIESDAARRRMVDFVRHAANWGTVLDDDRLTWSHAPIPLAVRSGSRQYDVLLCQNDQPLLRRQAACFTPEFYRHVRQCLNEGGVFCQRLRAIDYGPQVLAGLAAAWCEAFDDVAVVSAGGGDYLFLGSAGGPLGFDEHLAERLKRPHVRAALANIGTDWSTVLNVPLLTRDGLEQLVAQHQTQTRLPHVSSTFCLPYEMMRWGNKPQEMLQAWVGTQRQTRLVEQLGELANDPEILRRLAEVTAQQKLIRDFPDSYWWEYRRTLKDYMTRARTGIQQVAATDDRDRIHPDDRQRMAYFSSLGKVARQSRPNPAEFDRIEDAAAQYDPLVTLFMHQELAELHRRAEVRDPAAELEHRLHAIYHASGNDRSVRNVIDAITLVVEHPQACADPASRYDHLNSLAEMLKHRWNLRRSVNPKSARITINDINKSIVALDAACELMAKLAADAGVSPSQATAREQVLEMTLRRPLRSYRTQLQRHERTGRAVAEKTRQQSIPGL